MNRHKKRSHKHEYDGWIIVNKPINMTSYDALRQVKRALNVVKAGHAGTLDKPARGLLVIGLGKATKAIPFITEAFKKYHFVVNFGSSTTTDDATGEVVSLSKKRPSKDEILEVIPSFTGKIFQVPPQYSLVKVNGTRSYKIALKGERVSLAERPLHVKSLELTKWISENQAEFTMECGKGGYVRSIARDLGEQLGCFGHVETLTRMESGPFKLSDACELDYFSDSIKPEHIIIPLERALMGMLEIKLDESQRKLIKNGRSIRLNSECSDDQKAWVSFKGKAAAWGEIKNHEFFPKRVLC